MQTEPVFMKLWNNRASPYQKQELSRLYRYIRVVFMVLVLCILVKYSGESTVNPRQASGNIIYLKLHDHVQGTLE